MIYSQNQEQQHIEKYFSGSAPGSLLSIGENDGLTFSNARRLIELGWSAVLIEPSPTAFKNLSALYIDIPRVVCHNFAVGRTAGRFTLYESGAHVKNGIDQALVSSLNFAETEKWRNAGVKFTEVEVEVMSARDLFRQERFDFITIDAEGMDVEILREIPLTNTRLVCVEWNNNPINRTDIIKYCAGYGLTNIVYGSLENIILGR